MNYLSACAIIKNEDLYLDEWLTFHRAVGFEHFYLFDNNDLPTTFTAPDVTMIRWPGHAQQMQAFQHGLDTLKDKSRWVAFIDIDEFIVPINIDLQSYLKLMEMHPGIAFHWYLFGSNGLKNYEDKPVVERFTRRQPDVNQHIKCIIDPSRTWRPFTAHRFVHDTFLVDEHGLPIENNNPTPLGGTCDLVQVNHYVTKSYEESIERRGRPRADTGEIRYMNEFFPAHDRNEVEDFKARDFWRKIK